jgi:large conductance mechanosensitive channel
MLKDFKKFILRGNAVDLAVAVVFGAAFGAMVNALVKDIFTPLISAVLGKPDFSHLNFIINGSTFSYGDFLNAAIAFFSIVIVIFFFVIQPINKIQTYSNRKKDTQESDEKECPECLSVIPRKATRCKFCTTKLQAD